jgi:phosphoglycerate dehydrogenase-like enzyme
MSQDKPLALLWFGQHSPNFLTPSLIERMESLARIIVPNEFDRASFQKNSVQAEIVISTWGMPVLDQEALDQAPALKAVFYAAGSVKSWATEALWRRNIRVTSAASVNAVPVCHYTVSMILLSLKNVLPMTRRFPLLVRNAWQSSDATLFGVGNHSVVGLIGASKVGRLVMKELTRLNIQVLVFDPYLTIEAAGVLGVKKVELTELLQRSDVVSIHAPKTEQTHHMLHAGNLSMIKPGATLINTSRGDLIDEKALVHELRKGAWTAILDVTEPEPPEEGSELYTLPNCFLTPHVAGSIGFECRRMAEQAVDELSRYISGQPALEPVTLEQLRTMA